MQKQSTQRIFKHPLKKFLPPGHPKLLIFIQLILGMIIFLPILVILLHLFQPYSADFEHLVATVLPEFIWNSVSLTVAVGGCSLIIGCVSAWVITFCDFPGRNICRWALVLPLAFPSYVLSYLYTDWLQFVGPVQSFIRNITGWKVGEYWFPPIRSWGGAVIILSLAFYPYVYLLARSTFLRQSSAALEVSRTLNIRAWRTFFFITLPMARPALVAGTILVCMETVADFGAVSYFGIPTLTTGIYRAWTSLNDQTTAAQLSGLLLVIIFILLITEYFNRGQQRFQTTEQRFQKPSQYQLTGSKKLLAAFCCFMPIILGFILPIGLLITNVSQGLDDDDLSRLFPLIQHSFILAAVAASLALILGLFLTVMERFYHNPLLKIITRLAYLGYATPGIIIAVGLLTMLGKINNLTGQFLLTGSLLALIYCYQVRFLATSLLTLESGFGKIPIHIDFAGRSLGHSPLKVFSKIHLHFLWPTLLSAWLIIFIDVMKELAATYIIRPFNFETLAISTYRLIADERLVEASLPALTLVLLGIIPVIFLCRQIENKQHHPT